VTKREITNKAVAAVEYVSQGAAERVDGLGFKVYRAGTIIRVDIDTDAWINASDNLAVTPTRS